MEQLLADPTFKIYIAAVVVLGLNLLWLASFTAITRTGANQVVNPEDKKLNAEADVVFYDGNDKTQRYMRAHGNALQNTPLFLVTGFLLVLTPASFTVVAALFGVFVFFRLLHSFCYTKGIQPLRTLSFALSFFSQVGILGVLAYNVFMA